MSAQWVAGDVAVVTDPAHGELVAVLIGHDPGKRCWHSALPNGDLRCLDADQAESVRPLIVIDPEDAEAVGRLLASLVGMRFAADACGARSCLQTALRTYASPEVKEPQGLGARVNAVCRDDRGNDFGMATWARAETGEWVCLTDGMVGRTTSWAFLRDVEVLDA